MPHYCANLTFLFKELPFRERFAAAREAGFDAVEVLFPYDADAADMGQLLADNRLTLALINCPPPNYAEGPRGFAAVPELQDRFQYDFRRTLRYAGALGAQRVHIMAGVADGPEAHVCFVENLRWAAAFAPQKQLTIEPINSLAMPGYFLNDFDQAAAILDEIAAPNVSLQFDAYHAHTMTGDLMGTWAAHGHRATHIQVAGPHPNRAEPHSGEIDYAAFFAALDKSGFKGWVSGEYNPSAATQDGLHWRV